MQIVGSRLIPLHDLCDESPPARTVCFRVIDDRGHLCEVVVRAVFPELHRPQIQRSVLAVEQVDIPVVVFHGQWEHRLCILQHGFPMLSKLELPHPVDESLSGILLCDRQGKHIQLVRKQLRQLRHLEVFGVRLPDLPVIHIPDTTLTVIPGDGLEEISKHIAHADLIPAVSGIRVRSHLIQ